MQLLQMMLRHFVSPYPGFPLPCWSASDAVLLVSTCSRDRMIDLCDLFNLFTISFKASCDSLLLAVPFGFYQLSLIMIDIFAGEAAVELKYGRPQQRQQSLFLVHLRGLLYTAVQCRGFVWRCNIIESRWWFLRCFELVECHSSATINCWITSSMKGWMSTLIQKRYRLFPLVVSFHVLSNSIQTCMLANSERLPASWHLLDSWMLKEVTVEISQVSCLLIVNKTYLLIGHLFWLIWITISFASSCGFDNQEAATSWCFFFFDQVSWSHLYIQDLSKDFLFLHALLLFSIVSDIPLISKRHNCWFVSIQLPLSPSVRSFTVAKLDSIGFVVRKWIQCFAGKL